jgi:hypothetical protein
VLSAADRLAILELAARYNHAFDAGESEAWAACFTPDGVFAWGRDEAGGEARGRDALVAYNRNREGVTTRRHWTDNHVITGDSDRASHTCYLSLIRAGSGAVVVTGRYTDELERRGGVWLFRRRHVQPDG